MNGFDWEVAIVEFIGNEPIFDDNSLTLRLVCKTSEDDIIVFWGSSEGGTRNIDALKNQKLPVVIECQAYEPTERQKREFGTTYTVPEHSWITINPKIL